MNIYIIKTDIKIYPFGEGPSELFINNKKLKDIQVENIRKAGCTPIFIDNYEAVKDDSTHIVFYDNLFITAEAIQLIKRMGRIEQASFACTFDNPYYIESFLWHIKRDEGGGGYFASVLYVEKRKFSQKKKSHFI